MSLKNIDVDKAGLEQLLETRLDIAIEEKNFNDVVQFSNIIKNLEKMNDDQKEQLSGDMRNELKELKAIAELEDKITEAHNKGDFSGVVKYSNQLADLKAVIKSMREEGREEEESR